MQIYLRVYINSRPSQTRVWQWRTQDNYLMPRKAHLGRPSDFEVFMFVRWSPQCSGAPDDTCTVLAHPHLRCGTVGAPRILSRSAILCKLDPTWVRSVRIVDGVGVRLDKNYLYIVRWARWKLPLCAGANKFCRCGIGQLALSKFAFKTQRLSTVVGWNWCNVNAMKGPLSMVSQVT